MSPRARHREVHAAETLRADDVDRMSGFVGANVAEPCVEWIAEGELEHGRAACRHRLDEGMRGKDSWSCM